MSTEPRILIVRGHRVVLDADLARLYGVPTYRFNEAFKRNRHRFPDDFAFQLTADELANLRSQIAMSSSQDIDINKDMNNSSQNAMSSTNWSQFATNSSNRRGVTYLPWAFTEHGALMAANILRSQRAVEMSIFVVRAFVRLREQIAANHAILKRLDEIDRTLLQHDSMLWELYRKIKPLLEPVPAALEPPKRRIGFHREEARLAQQRLKLCQG